MNIHDCQLLGDRLLVKMDQAADQIGAIHLADMSKEAPSSGTVVLVGSGVKLPVCFKTGDRILVSRYGGSDFKFDGQEYQIFAEPDVLMVLPQPAKKNETAQSPD